MRGKAGLTAAPGVGQSLPAIGVQLERRQGRRDRLLAPESGIARPLFGGLCARRCLVIERLIDQLELAAIKLATNRLEQSYSQNYRRRVNIDPGYLLYERFVLASGKNFSHRIYIGRCIYADLTLIYRKGAFETLPWTYPDYADQPIRDFLERVRKKYAIDLKQKN